MRRFDINNISTKYTAKEITKDNAIEVFDIMKDNPLYFENLKEEASLNHVYHDIEALPPNKEYKDKYYFGLYDNDEMIAIVDLIDSFPNNETAFIGFFMMNKKYQLQAIGSSIINEMIAYLKNIGLKYIRLGYVKTNNQSKGFWYKNQFKPTGVESKNDNYTVVILERKIND